MGWSGGLADWIEDNVAYLSVVFSWRLPDAYQRAVWYGSQGYRVRAGGPGMWTPSLRRYLATVTEVGGEIDALPHHNPSATIASRGCPVGCYFCIVPKMEGREFTLLPDFTPRPILCDSNLSALPTNYQEYIIAKYKAAHVPLLDANSGFEPRTFDEGTYERWRTINRGPWRWAYDEEGEAEEARNVARILAEAPPYRKRVYVLIGNEPFESCYRRVAHVLEWGCEPHVQQLIALNALTRTPLVRYDWTAQRLRDLARWANRRIWRYAQFDEYRGNWQAALAAPEEANDG